MSDDKIVERVELGVVVTPGVVWLREPERERERLSPGGVVIPEKARQQEDSRYEVAYVSDVDDLPYGPGDSVFVYPFATTKLVVDDQEYRTARVEDILGYHLCG